MSTSIMTHFTPPFELSNTAATHYATSSTALPLPSLSSWSLDKSCTRFKIDKAVGTTTTTTTAANTAAATNTPSHPKSSRLIEDDPDGDEEAHIRGFKRNRKQAMTLSPATPSKRRCYPMMLRLLGNNPNSSVATKSEHCAFGAKRCSNNYPQYQQGFASLEIAAATRRDQGRADKSQNNDSNDTEVLLPPRLSRRPSYWPPFSSSFDPDQSGNNHVTSTESSPDSESPHFQKAYGSDEDDDESVCAPLPSPPQFRRNSTIRDSSDLAFSIEEFCQSLVTS